MMFEEVIPPPAPLEDEGSGLDQELPAYAPRTPLTSFTAPRIREQSTHVSELINKSKVWCTLNIVSSAPSSKHIPSWFDDEPITGTLNLNLEKDDPIKSITLNVNGQLVTSDSDEFVFLTLSEELWSVNKGDPRNPSETSPTKYTGKLRGQYSWPFAINIPRTTELKLPSGEVETVRLPPSFHKRLARATVQYRVEVCIQRTGLLQMDAIVGTNGYYTPTIYPAAPSLARQLAYQENSPLIGPEGDLDGWKTLRPVTVKGVLFSSKEVEADLTVFVAKPLQYTRGSVIPLQLRIQSADPQALDMLSVPTIVNIRLRLDLQVPTYEVSAEARHISLFTYRTKTVESNTATWWPSAYGPGSPEEQLKRRVLDGEIALPANLVTSFKLSKFRVHYHIAIFPSQAVAFAPSEDVNVPLLTEPVEIVSAYAPGPRPRSYASPEYQASGPDPGTQRERNRLVNQSSF